ERITRQLSRTINNQAEALEAELDGIKQGLGWELDGDDATVLTTRERVWTTALATTLGGPLVGAAVAIGGRPSLTAAVGGGAAGAIVITMPGVSGPILAPLGVAAATAAALLGTGIGLERRLKKVVKGKLLEGLADLRSKVLADLDKTIDARFNESEA